MYLVLFGVVMSYPPHPREEPAGGQGSESGHGRKDGHAATSTLSLHVSRRLEEEGHGPLQHRDTDTAPQ